MAVTQMWVHGSTLTLEAHSEQFLGLVRFGTGTQLNVPRGISSWMHLAVPTPAVLRSIRARLLRV
jgi:hypothetical protein